MPHKTPTASKNRYNSAQIATPQRHTSPLSADDKFLALAGYLLAVPIVYRVDKVGGIIMVALLVALASYVGRDDNER